MSSLTHSAIRCVLAYSLLMSPLLVHAQEAAQRAQWQTPMLRYVPDEAVFAALARPRHVLTDESMQMVPIEVLSAAGKKEFGIDPLDIVAALLVVGPPAGGPPSVGVVLQMRDENAALTMKQKPPFSHSANGIIIAASDEAFGEKIRSSVDGEMSALAHTMRSVNIDLTAAFDAAKVRPMIMGALASAPPLPPPFEPLKQAPQLIQRVDLRARVTTNQLGAIRIVANNEADAERVETLVGEALEAARAMLMQQLKSEMPDNDPVQLASQEYAARMMNLVFDSLRPSRQGDSLTFSAKGNQANQAAVIGILVALLLPAVQAARKAARRAQAINQVKQISLAMLNYESVHGTYPARANLDDEGKALLSWRVHILPYLEQEQLYQQFRLDEPWHSEHNRALIKKMPEIYANPDFADEGKTNFLVPVGPGTVFEGTEGRRIRTITDGTSNTILVVEADEDLAVEWTKPEDLTYDPDNPLNGLGNLRTGGFVAARCDGAVMFHANSIDKGLLAALFTCAAGDLAP